MYSFPLPQKTKNLLGVLHYHGSVQTNNKTNKKAFRNKQKQSILVTAQYSERQFCMCGFF